MVNLLKVIAHIKKVGWKQFIIEFKQGKKDLSKDPVTALNLQRTGYIGVIVFSAIASGTFFYKGLWYIGALFLFNILVQSGQLLSVRNQIKMFDDFK